MKESSSKLPVDEKQHDGPLGGVCDRANNSYTKLAGAITGILQGRNPILRLSTDMRDIWIGRYYEAEFT
jgi:hypothetical protein